MYPTGTAVGDYFQLADSQTAADGYNRAELELDIMFLEALLRIDEENVVPRRMSM